jgi:putative pyruvate formate lyase activating enzyme
MSQIRGIFKNYFNILEENGISKYIICKHIPAEFSTSDSTNSLWKKHDELIRKFKVNETEPKRSLLDLKIEISNRIFRDCIFCERRCHIDRTEKSGNCKVKQATIASEFLHLGEESILIPSYTIFFSGCTFHCVFCQNWDISQNCCGTYIESETLAMKINTRNTQGAKNVNWVGGDPTSNLSFILNVLKKTQVNIPQVWNSNMYCSEETFKLLDGLIDVYLTDFKYGNDKCAKRLSKVENYSNIVKRNHKIAQRQAEVIIRHLVLPNHIECCSKPILDWIQKNTPKVALNIMAQYRPEYNAQYYKDISESLSLDDYYQVIKYAKKLHLILI